MLVIMFGVGAIVGAAIGNLLMALMCASGRRQDAL
jgi:hypothetical protein